MSSCIKHRLYWVFFSGKKMNTLQLIFHIIRYSNKKYDINATNKQTNKPQTLHSWLLGQIFARHLQGRVIKAFLGRNAAALSMVLVPGKRTARLHLGPPSSALGGYLEKRKKKRFSADFCWFLWTLVQTQVTNNVHLRRAFTH